MEFFGLTIKKRFLSIPFFIGLIGLVYIVFVEKEEVQKNLSNVIKHKAEFIINGFKLFESRNDGKDWNLKASYAEIYKDTDKAILKNVKVTFYNTDGKIFKLFSDNATLYTKTKKVHLSNNVKAISDDGYSINTDYATFYPNKQLLTSTSKLTFDGPDLLITGKGFTGEINKKTISILNNVVTTVKKNSNSKLIETKKTNSNIKLQITSRSCLFNFKNNTATYSTEVVGTGKKIKLSANKVDVFYEIINGERSIKEILALGSVKIEKGTKHSLSNRALLIAAQKEIILTGDPSLRENGNTIKGEKIVYNYLTEKFKVLSAKGIYNTN